MELPVISTNWSGNTEFMREDNSFLVPVSAMVPALNVGHQWAQPSIDHLKKHMRYVFENPTKAKEIGKKARSDIAASYDLDRVAQIVLDKLKVIEANSNQLREGREEETGKKEKKQKQEREEKINKIQIKIVDDVWSCEIGFQ